MIFGYSTRFFCPSWLVQLVSSQLDLGFRLSGEQTATNTRSEGAAKTNGSSSDFPGDFHCHVCHGGHRQVAWPLVVVKKSPIYIYIYLYIYIYIYNQPGFWKTSGSMFGKKNRIFVEYLRQTETWLVVTGTLESCGVTNLPKWLFYGI